jgi:hypothetical protein
MSKKMTQVVGFNGRPVKGGLGVKLAILSDSEEKIFCLHAHQTQHTAADVELAVMSCLATRLPKPVPYDPHKRLFYAHTEYVRPKRENRVPLDVTSLEWWPGIESFWVYDNSSRIAHIIEGWINRLIEASHKLLNSEGAAEEVVSVLREDMSRIDSAFKLLTTLKAS